MVTADTPQCQGLVLVVDDRVDSRELIVDELHDLGLEVVEADNGESGWERFTEYSFDLVVTDLRMPRSDGLHLLKRIRSPQSPKPHVPVLILSAFGTLPIAAEAGNAGATAFYSYDDAGIDELKRKTSELLSSGQVALPLELSGQSPGICQVRDLAISFAELRTPVMVSGEAGSGRRACARFIHDSSGASSAPFVVYAADEFPPKCEGDCSIYLHEFDQFEVAAQRRWYQQIRDLEFFEHGAHQRILVSVSDSLGPIETGGRLEPAIAKALSPFRIDLPPLRHRKEDFSEIAKALLRSAEFRVGRRGYTFEQDALAILAQHNWYENISELDQVLRSIVASVDNRTITKRMAQTAISRVVTPLARIASEESRKERDRLIQLWTIHLSYTGVANELGVTRNTAKNRMAKYNLVPGQGGLPSSPKRGV